MIRDASRKIFVTWEKLRSAARACGVVQSRQEIESDSPLPWSKNNNILKLGPWKLWKICKKWAWEDPLHGPAQKSQEWCKMINKDRLRSVRRCDFTSHRLSKTRIGRGREHSHLSFPYTQKILFYWKKKSNARLLSCPKISHQSFRFPRSILLHTTHSIIINT